MKLMRLRRNEVFITMRDSFIVLAPIALTVGTVLWFVR